MIGTKSPSCTSFLRMNTGAITKAVPDNAFNNNISPSFALKILFCPNYMHQTLQGFFLQSIIWMLFCNLDEREEEERGGRAQEKRREESKK